MIYRSGFGDYSLGRGSAKEVASLAECLKQQRSELHDALVTSADLEAKSASMSER